jgi:flagellar hook-associated protein 1 FlgK
MSLFGSIRLAANSLAANQVALQVVGQNIANADTPGYIREEAILRPAPAVQYGSLLMGMGVEVDSIVQKIDKFLEQRLRGTISDRANAETQEENSVQLEAIVGELGDNDLSTAMNKFFSSIHEVLNQPEDVAVRNLSVLAGQSVTQEVNRLSQRTTEVRNAVDGQIADTADQINLLTQEIGQLNVRIVDAEGGGTSKSDAVGLRDQRQTAMEKLTELSGVECVEQPSGSVAVYAGGDYLVLDGTVRKVVAVQEGVGGYPQTTLKLADTDAKVETDGGKLQGMITSRDQILGGFLNRMDDFARTLAYEFNKVYSSGQGLNGYKELTSEFAVDDPDLPLDHAGLKYQPVNGSFQVSVHNTRTGLSQTENIRVDLNGSGGDDLTLEDLRKRLDSIDGLQATTSADGKLTLKAESADEEFSFSNDTSGLLAALGLNTFFSGYSAQSLSVNKEVVDDPSTFAASRGGIGADTDNAVDMADFLDRPLDSQGGTSIGVLYSRIVGQTTQDTATVKATADGTRTFEQTLRSQELSISGVSIDEEAVKMISYQRSYQASARFITTIQQLFDTLLAM